MLQHKIDIKDNTNKVVNQVSVNLVEKVEIEKISKVIKWQQSKIRSATHNTKDVSEIAYSTKKLRAQKGGGCARFRNKGAVQFRGGATIFGPDGRVYDYKINKKERVLGLQHAISLKIQNKELVVVKEMDFKQSTVKEFLQFKKNYGIETNSVLLIDEEKSMTILKAISNIHEANFLPIVGINVLSLIDNKFVIITANALKVLQERGVL
jgi:large subunit ribosomal protein L4